MPKPRSPSTDQAALPPAGDASPSPAGPPLVPVFNRKLLPKDVKKAATEAGISDQDILLFWAAYERGRQDEREGRLSALEERLAGLEGALNNGIPTLSRDPYPWPVVDPQDDGQSPRPDNNLPPRPDLDEMDRARASRAAGQGPMRVIKKEPTGQNAAGLELPIGRYPAELVTELVAFAQQNSTKPDRAREIMRDYLAECEPACKEPPSSTGKVVLLRMRAEKILKGEQVTNLGSFEELEAEGQVDQAVGAFGGAGE